MNDMTYSLDELEKETGFGKRKVRYYIREMIGTGQGTTGRNAGYPKSVRDKLLFVAKVQDRMPNLRLGDLKTIIEQTPDGDIARVADGDEPLEIADVRSAEGARDFEIRAKTGSRRQKVVAIRFDDEPVESFAGRADRKQPDNWMTIKLGQDAELRVRGKYSASKIKQLELLGELAKSILYSK